MQRQHQRVDVADVLRGFAVLAIILIHSVEHFNFYQFPDPATRGGWLAFIDKSVWDSLFFMFAGKAYAIFALLFGFSFFIQDRNRRLQGRDFRLRFCWRLILLLLIGQLNAAFFTGEVLVLYALVGFVLVAVSRFSTRVLVVTATLMIIQPVCIWQVIRAASDPDYITPALDTAGYWAATFAVQDGGSFLQTVKVNLWEGQLASLAWAWDNGRVFQTAALFIFGMLIGRHELFHRRNLRFWGVTLACGLILFFPLNGLASMTRHYIDNRNILVPLNLIITSLAKVSFMAVLTSGVIFGYYCTRRLSRLLAALIPYGRMSMTNYVTQGIIGSAIFYNWGLHLRAGILESVMIGVAIFVAQYVVCRIWIGHHNHGPLEYLWKKATWIEFPFRRA